MKDNKILEAKNILFFIPNLIDFARLFFIVLGFILGVQNNPSILYLSNIVVIWTISSVLDIFDGFFARKYNQTSWLGAILDMALDRAFDSIACILIAYKIGRCDELNDKTKLYLVSVYIALPFCDIFSHWCRTSQCYITGKKSHKFSEKNDNKLLVFYYKNRAFMGILVGMYDAFLISSFLLFSNYKICIHSITYFVVMLCTPPTILKFVIHIIQANCAIHNIALYDAMEYNEKNNQGNDN